MILTGHRTTDKLLIIETDEGEFKNRIDYAPAGIISKCEDNVGKDIDLIVRGGTGAGGLTWKELGWFADFNVTSKNEPAIPAYSDEERSVTRVVGPPGTGKTHSMMELIKEKLSEGVKPHEICFVSFTRVAANEAKERVFKHFPEYSKEDFDNFRTLHSLAASMGALKGKKLANSTTLKDFDMSINYSNVWGSMGDISSIMERTDHPALSVIGYSHATGTSLRSAAERHVVELERILPPNCKFSADDILCASVSGTGSFVDRVISWDAGYQDYKLKNNLIDFQDMIDNIKSMDIDKSVFRYKLFIVDEAQDLSSALWGFASMIIGEAKETYIVGDKDQAIMDGFGSASHIFSNYPVDNEEALSTSWRLPRSVHDMVKEFATTEYGVRKDAGKGIISTIKGIIHESGDTFRNVGFNIADLVDKIAEDPEKEWLIMAPTKQTVDNISRALQLLKIPHFKSNEPVLGRVSNIRVQTIHTSKGSEADNVAIVILNKGDRRMYKGSLKYVAETRTRDLLMFVRENGCTLLR